MVLLEDPPNSFQLALVPEHRQVLEEGARLRVRLPAYLAQRRALLDDHCPLLLPLRALVCGYYKPTTEEIWATLLAQTRDMTTQQPPFSSPLSANQGLV
jgi:hypothetical protein